MNRSRFMTFLAVVLAISAGTSRAGTYLLGENSEPDLIGAEGKPAKMEKVTYLGITAKPVDSTLQAQLNLPDGVGLTVMTVDHKGPSAADIQQDDVLQKLDDQLLIDAHQLVTLIHLHHPGDAVTITLIREAKPMRVTVKLGEKERVVPPPGDANRAALDKPSDDQIWPVPFDTQLPLGPSQPAMFFKDEVYSASVSTSKDGHKTLTVKDIANNVVAVGPIDTPEEWQKFSPDIRQHLDVMHKMLVQQQK